MTAVPAKKYFPEMTTVRCVGDSTGTVSDREPVSGLGSAAASRDSATGVGSVQVFASLLNEAMGGQVRDPEPVVSTSACLNCSAF